MLNRFEDTLVWWPEDNSLVKLADIDLGPDANSWINGIRSAFEQQHPELVEAGGRPSLVFNHKDFMGGDALGAIRITVSDKYMTFPVVLRGGKLAPFDSVHTNGHWHYADKDLMDALIHGYNLFLGPGERKDSIIPVITPTSSPWGRFNYGYTGPGGNTHKFASLRGIDTVKTKLASFIKHNPNIFANSSKAFREYVAEFSKLAEASSPSVDPAEFTVLQVYNSDVNKYTVKLACHGCNGVVTYENVPASRVKELASSFTKEGDKLLDVVDSRPGESVIIDKEPLSPCLDEDPTNKPGMIYTYGSYYVLLSDGTKDTGVVYPMVNWDFKGDKSLFYLSNLGWSIQKDIAGRPSSESFIAPNGPMSPGAQGVFVNESGGNSFSTPPFEIESIFTTDEGTAIRATDLRELGKLNLVLVPGIKSIMRIDPDAHPEVYEEGYINFYIPSTLKFLPIPSRRVAIIPDPQSVLKIAELRTEAEYLGETIKLAKRNSKSYTLDWAGYRFVEYPNRLSSCEGFSRFDKIAELNNRDALLAMVVAGLSQPDQQLRKMAESAYVQEIRVPSSMISHTARKIYSESNREKLEKVASVVWDRIYDELAPKLDSSDLFKIAAQMGDKPTLDQVFQLNFFNRDNLAYFAAHSELLNDAEEFLVKLLIVTRISNTGIDETSIIRTLDGLSDIQEGFKGIALRNKL